MFSNCCSPALSQLRGSLLKAELCPHFWQGPMRWVGIPPLGQAARPAAPVAAGRDPIMVDIFAGLGTVSDASVAAGFKVSRDLFWEEGRRRCWSISQEEGRLCMPLTAVAHLASCRGTQQALLCSLCRWRLGSRMTGARPVHG